METGTVLAIVSLGLTVCDGVIKYSSALKDRTGEVTSLVQTSSGLHRIFHSIASWLHSQTNLSPGMVSRVGASVETCLLHLDEILDLCTKYSRPSSKDIKFRLLHAKRGLTFPFKTDTIRKLRSRLEALKTNINLAL
ncbi:hypothetical protein QBC38DRAFT_169285 [Podospora fimiseda]|uniref:Fungal N-terminal domain-containing protein n=1 Tax=Podospora fimiseda TaxID=252190 RepID=A0AAN6YKE2_9PEZI|nr:hypothetical protein QBC38DRAFT_169285 [Podospora fimiseda]